MIDVLGLAGIILFFAGLHILWQSREEALYWLQKFLETFQKSLRTTAGLGGTSSGEDPARPESAKPSAGQVHAMRMMSAVGLLLLGPLLVLLSLFLSL
jgi:hypothetical protein